MNANANNWLDVILKTAIGLVMSLTLLYSTFREDGSKVIIEDNKKIREELNSKVDATYVDNRLKDYDAIQNERYMKVESSAILISEKLEALLQSIDKRLERLENRKQ